MKLSSSGTEPRCGNREPHEAHDYYLKCPNMCGDNCLGVPASGTDNAPDLDAAWESYRKMPSILSGESPKPELMMLSRIFMAVVTGDQLTAGDLQRAEHDVFAAGWNAARASEAPSLTDEQIEEYCARWEWSATYPPSVAREALEWARDFLAPSEPNGTMQPARGEVAR